MEPRRVGGPEGWGAQKGGGPRWVGGPAPKVWPRRVGGPKFRAFSSTFGLSGCRVKPRRPHQTGPPGLAHDSPRTPNGAHFRAPALQKHHQNSTRRPPERHKKSETVAGKGRKSAKFWAPPPFRGPHPFETTPFRGPHFSRFGPPTHRGSTLRGPTLRGSTLRGSTLRVFVLPCFSLLSVVCCFVLFCCGVVVLVRCVLCVCVCVLCVCLCVCCVCCGCFRPRLGRKPICAKIGFAKVGQHSKTPKIGQSRSKNWPKSVLAKVGHDRGPTLRGPTLRTWFGQSRKIRMAKVGLAKVGLSRCGGVRA